MEKLKEFARPVKGSSEIKSVAAISAGNDDEIGQMIADALDKVGRQCSAGSCEALWLATLPCFQKVSTQAGARAASGLQRAACHCQSSIQRHHARSGAPCA